jgi:hypothetical protein
MSEPLCLESCQQALQAIEVDPLNLPAEVLAHLDVCPTCAEVRVQWLAQEDFPPALAPAGYFDHLPGRMLRKLPSRRPRALRHQPWFWAAAAGLALAIGLAGYMAGRIQRSPLMEASMEPSLPGEPTELVVDTPFQEEEDVMSQFSSLSPDEAEAVLRQLEASASDRP